jgi:hypothetical protein
VGAGGEDDGGGVPFKGHGGELAEIGSGVPAWPRADGFPLQPAILKKALLFR